VAHSNSTRVKLDVKCYLVLLLVLEMIASRVKLACENEIVGIGKKVFVPPRIKRAFCLRHVNSFGVLFYDH